MKRKFLEDLGLDKEVIDKILDENSADIGKVKGEVSTMETKISNLETELTKSKETITERDKQLEALKKVDAEGLQAEITRLQTENKTQADNHAAEINQLKMNAALDATLIAAKAKNIKAVKALLDITKAELLEDGTIKGLDEQIKKLKGAEDSKFLFDSSKPGFKGTNPGDPSDDVPEITKEQFAKMGYKERVELFNTNKELYDSLKE